MLLLILLGLANADWWKPSKTLEITTSNFEALVGHQTFTVVEFYTPTCKDCKTIFKEWEEVWDYYFNQEDGPPLQIARINGSEQPDLAAKYQVRLYPTILFIPASTTDTTSIFQGVRTKKEFIKWIEKQLRLYEFSTIYKNKVEEGIENLKDLEEVIEGHRGDHEVDHDIENPDEDNAVYYEYEIVVGDVSSHNSDQMRAEFTRIHKEVEELKVFFLDELQTVSSISDNLRLLFQEGISQNTLKHIAIKKKLEDLEFDILNRSKAESAQTRFNYTHLFVFSGLGVIIGISIGIIGLKKKN